MASGEKLSLFQKLSLRLHFMICKTCRLLEKQFQQVVMSARRLHLEKNEIEEEAIRQLEDDVIKKAK